MNHGQINDRLAALSQGFIILTQPAIPSEPGEGPFHDPSLGQHHEAGHRVASLHNRQGPATPTQSPLDQRSGITTVSPDQTQSRKQAAKFSQHRLGADAILNIGGVHYHRQQHAQRIYRNMTLAALDLLGGIIAPRAPFSAVLTDWLSRIAALGVDLRPSWARTCGRRAS